MLDCLWCDQAIVFWIVSRADVVFWLLPFVGVSRCGKGVVSRPISSAVPVFRSSSDSQAQAQIAGGTAPAGFPGVAQGDGAVTVQGMQPLEVIFQQGFGNLAQVYASKTTHSTSVLDVFGGWVVGCRSKPQVVCAEGSRVLVLISFRGHVPFDIVDIRG